MDRTGAVGGQVSDPTARDQPLDDGGAAILHQMRAVHEDNIGLSLSSAPDLLAALRNDGANAFRAGGRFDFRMDQDVLDAAQAAPLGERIDLQCFQIERGWKL